MPKRNRFIWILGSIVLLQGITLILIASEKLSASNPSSSLDSIAILLLLAAIAISAYLWLTLKNNVLRPLRSISRGAKIILKTNAAHDLDVPSKHLLGELPELVHQLGDEINKSRLEVSRALKTGATQADNQKTYLEHVIRGLDEGVIVCDKNARILLYNPSAVRIMHNPESLGLGRSLYELLPRGPVEHTRETLGTRASTNSAQLATDFVCSVIGEEHMLLCRLGSLAGEGEEVSEAGFVMTLSDVTARQGALRKRSELLRKTVEELRSPLASLKSAAENIASHTDLPDELRGAFHKVILEESETLSKQVDDLADKTRKMLGGELVTTDIYSSDLIRSVSNREAISRGMQVTQTGLPLWLRVDSHAMSVLLEFYMLKINESQGVTEFDLDADQRDHKVYLDLSWRGRPLTPPQLSTWESETLADCVSLPTVEQVLRQHSSVIWSQQHPRIEGNSILRIPVPGSERQWENVVDDIPPRPITYDFDLSEMAGDDSALKSRRLRELNFVVFDSETTGLNPDQGDEIISIAGVRVVNQRILSDEVFDQFVNPGRAIPKASIRYHGITDDDVKDAPPIDDVLPQFKSFVGDSVMVAHNAWFDLKFLKRREMSSGIRFRNPVLDTLMLSVCLHGHEVDQSLDAIVERLGIEIFDRHTALADSLATAELLLRLIDLLEAQGIVTLQDAFDAYQ